MALFSDDIHDGFASWALGLAPYGGGDVGEVQFLASQVKAGDDGSFSDAFADLASSSRHQATSARCGP